MNPTPFPAWSAYRPPKPSLPGATTAIVLGVVGVAAGLCCLLPLAAAPLAWFHGARALRLDDREPGSWQGRGRARTGLVLGVIGTVALLVATLVMIAVGALLWLTLLAPSPY
ncbi:MAG: hypothetical protein QM621_12925 [Aeromicrobium sp.]|uniref:hypothetical protein n=1 Tax=Aeromicrobium sp. TaxID=1871063 RepID=UPI0039E4002F